MPKLALNFYEMDPWSKLEKSYKTLNKIYKTFADYVNYGKK